MTWDVPLFLSFHCLWTGLCWLLNLMKILFMTIIHGNSTFLLSRTHFIFIFLPNDLFVCGQKYLPFCLREVWVVTACLTLVKATAQRFTWRTVGPDMEKDFYRLQADLYFYARTKVSSPLMFQNFHHF